MNIDFTKTEFETLLEMIYLADWVLNAHKTGEPEKSAEHQKLKQKIYGMAKEFGCDEQIVFDEKLRGYFPTAAMEASDTIQNALGEYDADTFWAELLERLGERDLRRRFDPKRLEAMGADEYSAACFEAQEPYEKEFEDYGIDRLGIVTQQPPRRRR